MSVGDLEGKVLLETYRVGKQVGDGGMGAVYVATHLRLPTRVAIKVLHAEAAANPEIFARFRREAEITSALRHPNIVQVIDFNRLDGVTPYLVMEFLDGEDLSARLARRGRLELDEVVTLARAIGGGLTAAHGHTVVHRDLKPQNIFLCRHEQGDEVVEVPKIVDFGISKIRHVGVDTHQTQDKRLLGTPHYMSPEQAMGDNSEVDHRTDQWALAAIVYECLTGQRAFPGDNLTSILLKVIMEEPVPLTTYWPEVPRRVDAAIRRALSRNREDRYPSVLEFVRSLAGDAARSESSSGPIAKTPVYPAGPVPKAGPGTITSAHGDLVAPVKRRRRFRIQLAVVASTLFVAAGIGGIIWHQWPATKIAGASHAPNPSTQAVGGEGEAARGMKHVPIAGRVGGASGERPSQSVDPARKQPPLRESTAVNDRDPTKQPDPLPSSAGGRIAKHAANDSVRADQKRAVANKTTEGGNGKIRRRTKKTPIDDSKDVDVVLFKK